MKLTYRQLYERAMRYVGWQPEDLATNAELLAQAQTWPNLAMDDICRVGRWPWLYYTANVVLAAGAWTANLPADFAALEADSGIRVVGWHGVLESAGREALHKARSVDASGRPRAYCVEYSGSVWQLRVDVAADQAYTLVVPYERTMPAMAAAETVCPLPEGLHDVLRLGTLCYAEEEVDRAAGGRLRPMYEAAKQQAWLRRDVDPRPVGPLRRLGQGWPQAEIAPHQPLVELP